MSRKKNDTRTVEKNDTRTVLINTAGRLFADRGLQVPVRDIVKAAGQSLGSIRYHFGGKEELQEAILESITFGWRNKEDVVDYMLQNSYDLFKTSKGRKEILKRSYFILFAFINENTKYPDWTFGYICRILSSTTPPPCKDKLIERVIEPNRLCFCRILRAYCPELSELQVCVLYANLFAGPLYHFAGTYNIKRRVPFFQEITSKEFYMEMQNNLIQMAWLILEQARKDPTKAVSVSD